MYLETAKMNWVNCAQFCSYLENECWSRKKLCARCFCNGHKLTMKLEDFALLEIIGVGRYGVVYKAHSRITGKMVAIKKISTEAGGHRSALIEITLLRTLRYPNIVTLQGVICEDTTTIWLILEYLPMDLRQYMDKFEEGQVMNPRLVRSYLYQINRGILFCHKFRVVHRDLKPENLLITADGQIKIADFGTGRALGAPFEANTLTVGSLWFRAPEQLLGLTCYSFPIDIWALGCIFAEMVTGRPLMRGNDEMDQLSIMFRLLKTPTEDTLPGYSSLTHDQVPFPIWTNYTLRSRVKDLSEDGYELLQSMLLYNPVNRISAKRIVFHKYFNDLDLSIKPNLD